MSMTVARLMDEIEWAPYGSPDQHSPIVKTPEDANKLDMLLDVLGSLTRMMDTRLNYLTTDGKLIREWVESILELSTRYRRELEILQEEESKAGIQEEE